MLTLKNICYQVIEDNANKIILNNINLEVEDNETIIITGPNGSGKSTLAKIIMGLIKPTSGTIIFDKKDITNYSITERAKLGMSYAFQQPVLFKGLTVDKILNLATNKSNKLCNYCDYLSQVGLCARNYSSRALDNKLSGGELKRIEIATVLARNGKLNIFDEPEAGIDIWSFECLVSLFKQNDRTNIIISHQEKIFAVASRIIVLDKGEISKIVLPEDIGSIVKNRICERLKGEC